MASNKNYKTYNGRRPMRIIVKVLLIAIAALILLSVIIFFAFKSYIVYRDDTLYLDVPWLEQEADIPPDNLGVNISNE